MSDDQVPDLLCNGPRGRAPGWSRPGPRLVLIPLLLVLGASLAILSYLHSGGRHSNAPTEAGPRARQASPTPSTTVGLRLLALPGHLMGLGNELFLLNPRIPSVAMLRPGATAPAWTTKVPGFPVAAAAADGGADVWVATRDDQGTNTQGLDLVRLDRRSGRLAEHLVLPDVPFSLAVVGGTAWVGSDGQLLRIDLASHRVSRLVVPDAAGGGVTELLAEPSTARLYGLLTAGHRGQVLVWSTRDGHLIARHLEPGTADNNGFAPSSMALAFGALWVTTNTQDGGHGTLERLQRVSLQPLEPGRQRATALSAISAGFNALWITSSDNTGSPTLRCFTPTTPDYPLHRAFALQDDFSSNEPPAQTLAVVGSHVYVSGVLHRLQDIDAAAAC